MKNTKQAGDSEGLNRVPLITTWGIKSSLWAENKEGERNTRGVTVGTFQELQSRRRRDEFMVTGVENKERSRRFSHRVQKSYSNMNRAQPAVKEVKYNKTRSFTVTERQNNRSSCFSTSLSSMSVIVHYLYFALQYLFHLFWQLEISDVSVSQWGCNFTIGWMKTGEMILVFLDLYHEG